MRSDLTTGGGFRPDMPFHMVWLATDACTARCLHCSSNSAKRKSDELATPEVIDLIDQLAAAGVVDFGISGGEPLIRRDLFEIIAHAKLRGMSVGVASNGAKLPERVARKLADLGLNRLQVSLDGLPHAHDALRLWPGLFDRVLISIATARQVGLRVHVCCTINRLNVDHLEAFVERLAGFDVQRLNFSRYVPTGRGTDSLDLTDDEWRFVIETTSRLKAHYKGRLEIVSHLAQQILVDDEVTEMPGFIGCQAGRGQGCITANGTVLPCVLLPVAVGNVRQATFASIWSTSPIIRSLQDRDNLEGRCGSCAVRSRCGGCRAVAFAKTRRLFAADPRCWLPDRRAVGCVQH
ncbi:radical SAM protein [Mesorhizobium sp. B2-6-4]|uniref:radical SAM/SPASM domain-containing protein n=1 Tax=Mesorhizobium sp. B2-6-4 TaxID=2589913 RepID=UPI00112AF78C|nr:radical SAM protein [Mesorhizobium sp. B2-6-4]TPJ54850.1 radical SAM protein [Mesorhizobium sp. B2-6-4]